MLGLEREKKLSENLSRFIQKNSQKEIELVIKVYYEGFEQENLKGEQGIFP